MFERIGKLMIVGVALIGALSGNASAEEKRQGGTLTLVFGEHNADYVKNFNPFGVPLYSTPHFMFEPLVVYNIMHGGEAVPRLAEKFAYADDLQSVTYTLRSGLKWSDGAPLTTDDVLFTYDLIKKFKKLDKIGIWDNILSNVVKVDAQTVRFELKRPDITAQWLIADTLIVPAHQWSTVEDPVSFTNPNPIGSGPFTEITVFKPEVYEQCRNPHYWEAGKPYIDCLRVPRFKSNEDAQAALIAGEIDWTGTFIPDVEQTFVSKNPQYYHYWFPPNDNISLYVNTTKKPFDDVVFRRALSMAIDRPTIVETATYGYATVSPYPTGLGEIYKDWYDPELNATLGKLGTYAPEESKKLLDEAGYVDKDGDGFRDFPDDAPLQFSIAVVKGWTDWEAAISMVTEYLKEIGLNATMDAVEFHPWIDNLQAGQYDLAIAWGAVHQSPWRYYYNLLHAALMGEKAEEISWSRWSSPEAEALLEAYVKTQDQQEHRKIIGQLQRIVAENVPIIPLFSNPSWYEYNDSRFIGWSTADNPFVRPMCFLQVPERLLHVLNLSLRPDAPAK